MSGIDNFNVFYQAVILKEAIMHAKITLKEYEEDKTKFIKVFKQFFSFTFACSFIVIKMQNTEDGKKIRRIYQLRIRSLEELSRQMRRIINHVHFYFYVLIIIVF